MSKLKNLFLFRNPWLLIIGIQAIFILFVFYQTFFHGLITIPTDILTGVYYPWLDFKYGFPVHVPVKNPMPSDVISIIYPWRMLGISILKSGHLPLWDDTILLGNPLLANFQSALLNPLNIFFFIFSDPISWTLQTIAQPILLYSAMFLFLKKANFKLSNQAIIIGSLLYAFSGYAMVWLEYNLVTYTLIYVPLIFLLTHKILENPKLKYAFLLGLVICLQIFSGYPLSTIYTLIFAGLYFLYFYFRTYPTHFKTKGLIFSIGVITGFCLAGIQLLPGLETTSNSIRQFDQTAIIANIKYLPLTSFFSFFIPDLYGNPGSGNYWGEGSYDNFAFFIAAIGIFLFLISLSSRIAFKKDYIIYLLFILLGFLIATRNPISELFSKSGFLGLDAAVNTRVLFIVCFAVSILASLAFDYLSTHKLSFFQKIIPLAIYLGIILGFGLIYLNLKQQIHAIHQLRSTISPDIISSLAINQEVNKVFDTTLANFIIGFRNSVIPLIAIFIATLSLWLRNKKIIFSIIIILLLFSTKNSFDKYLNFTKIDLFYPQTQALTDLKNLTGNHRFAEEAAEVLPSNTWTPYSLKSAVGQNALVPINTARYLSLMNNGTIDDNSLSRFLDLQNLSSPLLNTLDVQSVVLLNRDKTASIPSPTGEPFPWFIQPNWTQSASDGSLRIYNNPSNLGQAWFVPNTECQNSIKASENVLKDPAYNPASTMVINCNNSLHNLQVGQLLSSNSHPNYYQFQVDNPNANYLNISLTNFPGWQAYIDHQITPIFKSNIALSAVFVPQGQHTIQLFYQPQSFKWGSIISLGAALVWLIYFLIFGSRKFLNRNESTTGLPF